jgi:hypothetical protein
MSQCHTFLEKYQSDNHPDAYERERDFERKGFESGPT